MHQPARNLLLVAATAMLNACSVVTVADATVSAVSTTVEVAAAGVSAVVSDDDDEDTRSEKKE